MHPQFQRHNPRGRGVVLSIVAVIALLAPDGIAQSGPLDAPRLDPLATTPVWRTILFEKPLPLVAVSVGIGLAGAWGLRRSDLRRATLVAGVGIGLGASLTVVAATVNTEREELDRATRRLVKAVADPDAQYLRRSFASDVRAEGPGLALAGREALVSWLESHMRGGYQVRSYRVLEVRAGLDSSQVARSQARVRVQLEQSRVPNVLWFHMDWYRGASGEDWQLRGVRPVWVSGFGNIDRR